MGAQLGNRLLSSKIRVEKKKSLYFVLTYVNDFGIFEDLTRVTEVTKVRTSISKFKILVII